MVCNNVHKIPSATFTCDLPKGHAGRHSEAYAAPGGKTKRISWDDDGSGHPICPFCGHYIPNDLIPGAYPGAISRLDNSTEICSACGEAEAMTEFLLNHPDARQ